MAGLVLLGLALPLAVSTPWAKAFVFERAAVWARNQMGLEIHAATFDYSLPRLRLHVEDLTVAEIATPERPMARVAQLDMELAVSALRGRLDFESIRARDARLVFDPTTRAPRTPSTRTEGTGDPRLPGFSIDSLQIENLDVAVGDEDVRLDVHGVSADLRGFRRPNVLEGTLAATRGLVVSFDTEAMRVVFDRVDARVSLEDNAGFTGELRASSPVAAVRADGRVPLSLDGPLALQYDGTVTLAQLSQWWRTSPSWTGAVAIAGSVAGPLRSPAASFRARGRDLTWSTLSSSTLAAAGRVSRSGLELDSAALTSRGASLNGRATLGFTPMERSEFSGRWANLGLNLVAELFGRRFTAPSPVTTAGTATLSWMGPQPRIGEIEGRADITGRGTAKDETATAHLVAASRGGAWHVDYRQMLDGDTTAGVVGAVKLDAEHLPSSSIEGAVTLRAQDAAGAVAQLHRLGVVPFVDVGGIKTEHVTFDGTVAGTVSTPSTSGALEASGIAVGAIRDVRLSGTVAVDGHGVRVSPLEIDARGDRATLHGTLPWRQGAGAGTFTAHVEHPGRLVKPLPEEWTPAGVIDASGEWAGRLGAVEARADVAGAGLVLNGLSFDTLTARASYAGHRLAVEDLRATQASGALSGSGAWDVLGRTLRADLTATTIDLAVHAPAGGGAPAIRARVDGISFEAHMNGALDRPDSSVVLSAAAGEIDGRELGALSATAVASGGRARITAAAPAYGATLEGELTFDPSWPFEGRLTLTGADAAALGRLGRLDDTLLDGMRASVDATLDVSGHGRELAATTATIALARVDGALRGQPLTLAEPGRIQVVSERARVLTPLRMNWGSTSLAVADAAGTARRPGITAGIQGSLADITALVPELLPEGIAAEGTVQADLLLSDRITDLQPTGTMNLTLASLMQGDLELARDLTVRAEADPEQIRMREVRGVVLGGPLEAEGAAPVAWFTGGDGQSSTTKTAPATFRVRSNVALGTVAAAVRGAAPDVAGTLDVTIDGTAAAPRLSAVRATLRGEGGALTAGAFKVNTPGGTSVRLEDGRLIVDAFHWKGPDSDVTITGAVGVVDGVDGRLHLSGNTSLGALTLFVPARVDGHSTFELDLSGMPGARDVIGTIDVEDGTMVVPEWRLSMADWSGSLALGANGIEVRQLQGQFNGGQVSIEGRLPLAGASSRDRVRLSMRNAFLDVPRGFRSQLDAELEWSRGTNAPRLSGSATVTARTYREPVTEIARLVSGLIDGQGAAPRALPATLASTELDVRLSSVGPLAMTNSIARVELMPDLQLTGTMAQPALRGQVAVADEGRIQFSGRQYRLRESRLEFSPEQGLLPRLAVGGETRVGDYTVFLRLSGPVNEIETALTSDPPLGERDLQSLLVTGQREELGRGSSSDQNAVGAVSGDVLGFAGQFLGFDSVTVSTTDDLALVSSDVDPALRLTVSKRLGRRFELVLSDNLDDNELTWVIIYRPRPGFEFRLISRDNTEFTGEFRQEIFFGPGVAPPRRTARRQAARDRVSAITVAGDAGFPPDVVLAATSLRAGDRFEFGRWLDDRDAIARLYRERGYLGARIIPTRQDAADAGGGRRVSLNYRISRGPETVLTVQGYTAPAALLDRLRQAWADSVLVELLDTDLERVMREHLVDRGYLRAAITVTVEHHAAERIAAVITVDPGPLTTERRVTFSGNRAIEEKVLLADAAAQGVLASAWMDPAPLLAWVESSYVARGYLAVKVSARAVEHTGALAKLPVVIMEGPLATVATLSVAGVERVSEAEAVKAAGISLGSPYLAGSEQLARLALERHYRNLGYRDASVRSRATVAAADGRVELALSVSEGPRYIVQSVRTSGVESTRDSIVARATRIRPGVPASPALAESTRRQLYDVGTFRSANVTFEPVAAGTGADTVPVDAVVSLQESKRFLFLYGIETTNQYQSVFDQRVTTGGVAADLRDRNFLGRGWTLGAGLRYEPSFESGRVLLAIPRLRSKRIRTNIYADTSSEERARTESVVLRDDETTLTIEQRWRPYRSIELSWGYHYNYRNLRFTSADANAQLLDFDGILAGPAGALVIDRRDNLFDARRGWLMSATAEWGLQPLASDFDYIRTVARASHYLPVGPLTIASNVRWGDLVPLNGQPPITVLDIFFTAGGTQTVRGFKQDSLSAYYLDPEGLRVPVGGSKLLVFNEEVRFPLFWLLSGAGFVDAGNTFADAKGITLRDLAVGTGFGLRIRTPLAPVRIDLGFPIRSSTGQTSIRWHFSIGQIF